MGQPPKKNSIAQFYMTHERFSEKVSQAFKERCEQDETPKSHMLAVRCEVARDLFDLEPQEVQEELRRELDEAYEALLVEYSAVGVDEVSIDAESQAAYVLFFYLNASFSNSLLAREGCC